MKTGLGFILLTGLVVFHLKDAGKPKKHIFHTANSTEGTPPITYCLLPIDSVNKAWIKAIRSEDTLRILKALNRTDIKYLLHQDSIVVPSVFTSDLLDYSPFPRQVTQLGWVNKLIVFSYPIQAFAVYEKGKLVRWGPVSMGKQSTPTPLGLYFTNWKAKRAVSTVNRRWIMYWYFNLDNAKGVSMHEFGMPGYPASHACIRLLKEDAFWFYQWADEWILTSNTQIAAYGTPVKIIGMYPFGARKPWFSLANNNHLLDVSEAQIESELRNDIPIILQRQEQRDSVMEIGK